MHFWLTSHGGLEFCFFGIDKIVLARASLKLPFPKKCFWKLSRSNENDRMWKKNQTVWLDENGLILIFKLILRILMLSPPNQFQSTLYFIWVIAKILFKIDIHINLINLISRYIWMKPDKTMSLYGYSLLLSKVKWLFDLDVDTNQTK